MIDFAVLTVDKLEAFGQLDIIYGAVAFGSSSRLAISLSYLPRAHYNFKYSLKNALTPKRNGSAATAAGIQTAIDDFYQ
jgi:hypothetical protein